MWSVERERESERGRLKIKIKIKIKIKKKKRETRRPALRRGVMCLEGRNRGRPSSEREGARWPLSVAAGAYPGQLECTHEGGGVEQVRGLKRLCQFIIQKRH